MDKVFQNESFDASQIPDRAINLIVRRSPRTPPITKRRTASRGPVMTEERICWTSVAQLRSWSLNLTRVIPSLLKCSVGRADMSETKNISSSDPDIRGDRYWSSRDIGLRTKSSTGYVCVETRSGEGD